MDKKCLSCGVSFQITDGDLNFYKKIAVPDPTCCPGCREQRRLIFRNERSLYKRKCCFCGKSVVSIYSEDKPYKQCCPECFYSDKWNAFDYGVDFDFSRPFFEQFLELKKKIPRINNGSLNNENCEYTNFTADCKNCYLTIAAENSENCCYSKLCQRNRDCMDCDYIWDSELCYDCLNISKCYSCTACIELENCSDCSFCFNLKGCKNCLFSYNLVNKEYCIDNKQYVKEDYERKKSEFDFGDSEIYKKALFALSENMSKRAYHKALSQINCIDCIGNDLKNSNSMWSCFDMQNSEHCAYCSEGDAKYCYDSNSLYYSPELCYETISMLNNYNCHFISFCYYSNDLMYCDTCYYGKNLFGCVGLNHAEYCVFNKKYSKEDYEKLVPKIIEYMKQPLANGAGQAGEFGEFFPSNLSPFAYNETIAQEYYPLQKEEALKKGYAWKD